MDRLSIVKNVAVAITVVTGGLLSLQCRPEQHDTPPAPSRVVAVQQRESAEDPLPAFCDYLDEKGETKILALPPLEDAQYTKSTAKTQWVVLWATWCAPCIKEMPHIVEWVNRLKKSGASIDVAFISVDEDAAALRRFYKKHTELPPSAHLQDPGELPKLIEAAGLDGGAGLPIHIFVQRSRSVRCARAAAVNAADFFALERITQL